MAYPNIFAGKDIRMQFPPLEDWQRPVMTDIRNSERDIYVVKAKRQVGKSILAEVAVLFKAMSKPGSISVIVEPTLSQGRRVFKQLIKSIGGDSSDVIKSANATLLEIEFINGSSVLFKAAEQRENLRGLTVSGILVIDEGAFIDEDIYEILYPCVDANLAPILIISTPLFSSGEFWRRYQEGLTDNPVIKSYDWSKFDTSKYLSKEKLEYYRERLSPLRFRSEYLGEFILEGSYVFGNIDSSIGEFSTEEPVFGGLDWGNGGENDYSVLTLLDKDGNIVSIHAVNNLSPTQQIEYFSDIINSLHLKTVQVELNSIGTVYRDMLQGRVGTFIQGFNTTNESKRRIIEQLITAVQNNKIIIPADEELLKELRLFNIEKTKTGYTYNGRGAHDDYVMALAFAYDAYLNNYGNFSIGFA